MKFIDVVKKFISPLLSVNEVRLIKKECLKKTPSDFCTKESQKLSLRKEKVKNGNKIELIRTQTFSDEERLIVDEFLSFLSSKNLYKTASELDYSIYSKVLELTMLKTAMAGIENNTFFRDLSFLLDYWSNRTYEGNKISFAIKIRDITNAKKVFFDECKQDYFASLSNGVDEYIQLNDSGEVDKIIFCEEKDLNAQAPLRFLKLAKASNDCVITALTRNSEILIFKDEKIWAAKRNMQWILYTHDTYLKKMSLGIPKWTKNLKETMYQTALDTSFTKTGAILAMLFYDEKKEEIENIIGKDKLLVSDSESNKKIKTIRNLIKKSDGELYKFQELGRALRAELASMDGALIFSTAGEILAIGAIINQVDKGQNNGGGRSAATKMLAKYGIAMKISNDTYIECYATERKNIGDAAEPQRLFTIGNKNS